VDGLDSRWTFSQSADLRASVEGFNRSPWLFFDRTLRCVFVTPNDPLSGAPLAARRLQRWVGRHFDSSLGQVHLR
jgi:hypothetical protein